VKLSHRGLYALRALVFLAERHGHGLASVQEIAEAEGIPVKFLESILGILRNARFVSSNRGRTGGYELYANPAEVRVGDIIRLIDGPLAPFSDLRGLTLRVATESRHPGLFDLLLDVRNAASAILDHTTLADLIERDRRIIENRTQSESE
jgi:Rrf2 family protein